MEASRAGFQTQRANETAAAQNSIAPCHLFPGQKHLLSKQDRIEEIRDLGRRAFQALGCNGVARIDFFIDLQSNKIFINEINT
ncbi:MAG: hypothetical protein LBB68_00140, partial [Treponema sp.]|nr:hypothetical protein [Treponema sp.]